jgi:tRNA-splicing ligase RtcB (3'-phosphate/5'-hydroxy nucleic acid ligase)
MINEITSEKLPIKLWLKDIEDGALEQAKNLANHPYAFKHIALMPDCHQGFGMPIGGVLATKDVIIPNAVGVDIGCGMCAIQTSLKYIEKDKLKIILNDIRQLIPLGFKHHKTQQPEELMPKGYDLDKIPIARREHESARRQIGTLGGGNHFIEIQKSNDDLIWIMVHSGSRNIGKQVADYYNRMAVDLNEKMKSPVLKSAQLAYLHLDSEQGIQYYNEMKYCVEFALANRKLMMERIMEVFSNVIGSIKFSPMINIAHNYAGKELHFGREVIIHRKGATKADKNTTGIIPGSQGTNSYIVKGKGNKESFESCSHGAGRVMGRKQAIRSLDLKKEINYLNEKGIIHSIKTANDLEEASGAYKNIVEVMKNQADLVEIIVELRPLAVIKG